MADYFLDDFANATNDGTTWEKCFETWAEVAAAGVLTAANRLIVGADANITDPAAALTITGPTSGLPTTIISSTVGTGTAVSYAKGTGTQADTTDGANDITFDGSFALHGLKIVSGKGILFASDSNEYFHSRACTLAPAANSSITLGAAQNRIITEDLTIDLTADGTTNRSGTVINGNSAITSDVRGVTFINAAYRTGSVFGGGNQWCLSGANFSGFTNGTACEIVGIADGYGIIAVANCLTAATWTPTTGSPRTGCSISMSNVGPADAPTYLYVADSVGALVSSAEIYRTGGATVEGDACSWLITTTATCSESVPFYTPWIYGTVSSTGSKTFTLYITNDTADFDNSMVWLEVEYLSTSDEAIWALGSDQRDNSTGAFISITEAVDAQTDDTTSSWVGLNDAGQGLGDYMQSLAVTATVNETGQFRARVAVGVASIASSRYFYCDCKVTVS